MSFLSGKSSKKSFSRFATCQNKQNESIWQNGQKDICKILEHFNISIRQNKDAIKHLQNRLQKQNLNQNIQIWDNDEKLHGIYDTGYQSVNQTALTINKYNSISNLSNINKLIQIEERIDNLSSQIKRKQNQSKLNLQIRLSEKGEKSQIQKAINLSRLLVVEIEQIQERFEENERVTKTHEQRLQKMKNNNQKKEQQHQSKLLTLNQKNQKEKQSLEMRHKQHDFVQNQNQFIQKVLQKINSTLLPHIQNKVSQKVKSCTKKQIELVKFYVQQIKNISIQDIVKQNKSQLSNLYQRIQNLENHSQQSQQSFDHKVQNIKLQIEKIKKQTLKLGEENVKINKKEANLLKKMQIFQTIYTKKNDFLDTKQHFNNTTKQTNQTTKNIQSQIIKLDKQMQNVFNSLKNINQSILKSFNNKISDMMSQLNKTRATIEQTLTQNLSKYAKTQSMKKYFASQNQKVYQIINSNFEQQKQVNQTLCSQNILARWIWDGQELKGGYLISWNKQIINTLPQNFKFSQQKSNIIEISNGGIYKFELGFYAKKKPTIQILINGKVIISAVNSSSYVIHHSSGRLKGIQSTQISGLTLVDFFLIPQNSRIAISYNGDLKSEGFLNIHRL